MRYQSASSHIDTTMHVQYADNHRISINGFPIDNTLICVIIKFLINHLVL